MDNNLMINEKTRVIASNIDDDIYLATNDENANFNTFRAKCFIIDANANIISSLIYIGAITKQGVWVPASFNVSDLNIHKNRGI